MSEFGSSFLFSFSDISCVQSTASFTTCHFACDTSAAFTPLVSKPLSCESNSDVFTLPDVTCKTKAQADIVLLVDGSWSIGRLNFRTIRAFIARMVGVFDIGPDRVQVGRSTRIQSIHEKRICLDLVFKDPSFVFSSCSVQRRPKDLLAFVRASNQGLSSRCYL